MGFFKDFKDDFSDAVNELVPEDSDSSVTEYNEPTNMNDSLDEAIDVDDELSKLDGLFEQVSKKVENGESISSSDDTASSEEKEDKKEGLFDKKKSKKKDKDNKQDNTDTFKTYIPEEYTMDTTPATSAPAPTPAPAPAAVQTPAPMPAPVPVVATITCAPTPMVISLHDDRLLAL